jgi:hypothetical protein
MPRAVHGAAVAAMLLLLPACFTSKANLTESGKGRPVLTIEFPEVSEPESVQDAVLEVTNPGPEDMQTVAVAFALVGPAAGQIEFPNILVPFGMGRDNPAIAEVEPEPEAISDDGAVYFFGPLAEDASLTITFSIVVPDETGVAANSVQVYDGGEIDRAKGIRLETLVE